jgi:hypothetical protein
MLRGWRRRIWCWPMVSGHEIYFLLIISTFNFKPNQDQNSDCFKTYDSISVAVRLFHITQISPRMLRGWPRWIWWWPIDVRTWHILRWQEVSHCSIIHQTYVEDIQWSGGNWYGFMTRNGICFLIMICDECQIFSQSRKKLAWPDTTRQAGASITL